MALAAGRGTRLGQLTASVPKPLLRVGGVALLDHALERLAAVATHSAVNAHHLADQIADHLPRRVHLSVEEELLGTAGAIGRLRQWINGRAVAITNADAWLWPNPLPSMAADWSGGTVRLSVVRDAARSDFEGGLRYSGCCLLPGLLAADLLDEPSGLFEVCWQPLLGSSGLELVEHPGRFFDCGTPLELAAARAAAAPGLEPDAV
ncbi:MAG TPA: NTP transferase domain-containing protein [Acidimicrobiales bacterium]|nr:NTP transferase domain-containing protein [Acidimicrobiales bacterium]